MTRKENIWFGTVIVLLLTVALTMGWLGWKTAPDAVQPHDISLAQGTLCFTTPGSEVRGKLVDDIVGAHTSVLVECYLISDPAVVEALQTAKLHGCDVRVIMEENPFGASHEQLCAQPTAQRGGRCGVGQQVICLYSCQIRCGGRTDSLAHDCKPDQERL